MTVVWASSDDGNETENESNNMISNTDTNSNTSGNDTSNDTSNNNSNDTNRDTSSNTSNDTNSNTSSSTSNNTSNEPTSTTTTTISSSRTRSSNKHHHMRPRQDPETIDPQTGLSLATLRILARFSPCKRQLLLNYRRLLRSPTIRLQFYRDLYQRHQSKYVKSGCGAGDGDGRVKLGYRERAVLLGDPAFRARVEKLMRRRQPIGVAINGPVRYPSDIAMNNTQPPQNFLTITKQY